MSVYSAYDPKTIQDMRTLIALIMDVTDGHDHDGTNSKAVTTGTPADGAVTLAKLAANALAASAAGRSKMQDGFFDAATVAAKFATDSFTAAVLLQLIQDGAFAANAATRALFADGIFTPEKLTDIAASNVLSYQVEDLAANGNITGRALLVCPAGATMTLISADIIPLGASEGIDDINTAVVTLTNGTNTIVAKTYNTDTQPPAAGVVGNLGTLDATHKVLAAGEKLTLSVAQGTLADLPGFMLQVQYKLGTA